MASTTFTVRVDESVKAQLEALAKSTGRSRSFLAAEAIDAYLAINSWQVSGIETALASAGRGELTGHDSVREWVESWDNDAEIPPPRSKT